MMYEHTGELPDPFKFNDESYVTDQQSWRQRRVEIAKCIIDIEYGGIPPIPDVTTIELLHTSYPRWMEGVRFESYRVHCGSRREYSFGLTLYVPAGEGPFPVVLNGDGCWRYVKDSIVEDVMARGFILAQFNRVEIAPDVGVNSRDTGIYPIYPGEYGALSAWAWGYHRCIDGLVTLKDVDAARIAISGHSRGGKTTLLAGATDERIALVNANGSGCGGGGCYRWHGEQAEHLSDILKAFPFWFGPKLQQYVGKESTLPFDQHFLKALVAPRALLCTEALGDLWANPTGTWQTHRATAEVYRYLGAEDKLELHYREGDHEHSAEDWHLLLDYIEWQLCGKSQPECTQPTLFADLPKIFSWSAPNI